MELRHLRYFVVVAEELHFRRAAEKLFIVQPALSRQIKELEKELGVLLLNRTKRVVTLTEAGKFFYNEVKNLFATIEDIKEETKQIETGSVGRIKIGYVGSAMLSVLPKLIPKLQKEHKGLHFELYEMTAMSQLEALKSGKIDIGFLRVPREDMELAFETIFNETYSIVLPNDHKKNAQNFKNLKEFSEEDFILPPRSAGERYYDNIISLCNAAGFSPKISHEAVFEAAAVRLIENHMGISIFPTSFRHAFNAGVKFIELKKNPQRLQLSVAYSKDNQNPTLLTIINIIRKTRYSN
jgi:DNA-binding transcriptional LysR family regulator